MSKKKLYEIDLVHNIPFTVRIFNVEFPLKINTKFLLYYILEGISICKDNKINFNLEIPKIKSSISIPVNEILNYSELNIGYYVLKLVLAELEYYEYKLINIRRNKCH